MSGKLVVPVRLTRSRARGARLTSPNGLPIVCVSRETRWGNPYALTDYQFANADGSAAKHNAEAAREMSLRDFEHALNCDLLKYSVDDVKRELRGKNLACWCKSGLACHADILLRIANESSWLT
jgi:hypothetical protein